MFVQQPIYDEFLSFSHVLCTVFRYIEARTADDYLIEKQFVSNPSKDHEPMNEVDLASFLYQLLVDEYKISVVAKFLNNVQGIVTNVDTEDWEPAMRQHLLTLVKQVITMMSMLTSNSAGDE